MSSSTSTSSGFDPTQQIIYMTAGDNQTLIPVSVADIDAFRILNTGNAISWAVQLGGCIVMLLIVLLMTPKNRFARTNTTINIASLVVAILRCLLDVLFFQSSYLEFYVFWSGDYSHVSSADIRNSVVAQLLAPVQLLLIEAALGVQAYAMVSLWSQRWKWPAVVVSGIIVFLALGFKCASSSIQLHSILSFSPGDLSLDWVRNSDLALSTTLIIWFCFIFVLRLIMHMVEHNSLLPTVQGLNAMEILVMTNGVLMIVPAIFTGMQYASFQDFEMGSVVYTSVVIILPLGTLAAQRIAHAPAAPRPSQQSNSNISHTYVSGMSSRKKSAVGTWSQDSAADDVRSTTGLTADNGIRVTDTFDLELQRYGGAGNVGHHHRVRAESKF